MKQSHFITGQSFSFLSLFFYPYFLSLSAPHKLELNPFGFLPTSKLEDKAETILFFWLLFISFPLPHHLQFCIRSLYFFVISIFLCLAVMADTSESNNNHVVNVSEAVNDNPPKPKHEPSLFTSVLFLQKVISHSLLVYYFDKPILAKRLIPVCLSESIPDAK